MAMRQMMKLTKARIRMEYVNDLLEQLLKMNIGTNDVENNVRKMLQDNNSSSRKKVVRCIMKEKINNAKQELRTIKRRETKYWRQIRPKIRHNGIERGFNQEWSKEKSLNRKMYKETRKQKVEWLSSKHDKRANDIPDEFNGITIKDQELGEEYKKECKIYGGLEVSEKEKAAASLTPKHTVYRNINIMEGEAEIEKGLTKYRWKDISKEKEVIIQQNEELRKERENEEYRDDAFDFKNNVFDYRNSRSTNLPFNARTCMPPKLKDEKEVPLQELKLKLTNITKDYAKKNKNEKKNLSDNEKEGIKSLIERRDNKEIVIFQTDKSGKFSIDSTENYVASSRVHFQDETITMEEAREIETEVNAHAVFWVRMMKAGENQNDGERYESSMRSHYGKVSEAYTFRKDHKQYDDEEKGPPVRPVCDGSDSIGRRFSYMISRILQEVNKEKESGCNSTEDMLAAIQHTNNVIKDIREEVVIGSADVKALYPSLDIGFTIEIVCEEFIRSVISFEGVDSEELGLYLALNYSETQLEQKGLHRFCPTRRSQMGPKPKIRASGSTAKRKERFDPWHKRKEEPNKEKEKEMIAEALKVALKLILNNHCYMFNNEVKKQNEGGPIGLDITGVIARIFMSWWDRQINDRLQTNDVKVFLYKRYEDDINMCVNAIRPGMKWDGNELVYDERTESTEKEKESDKRTFDIIKEIGNSIHRSIQLVTDIPSENDDKKIPILDLKVSTKEIMTENGKVTKIRNEFYMKDVSTKFMVDADSAGPWKTKMTVMTQQCLRVLLNCCPDLEESIVIEHMNSFMKRLQASGYDKSTRYHVIKSAYKAYEKIKEDDANGIRPMYRSKNWNTIERRKERKAKKTSWYGNFDSVIFVEATPDSELKKLFDKEIKQRRMKIKVVERTGTKMKNILQKNSVLNDKQCTEDCFVCATTGKGNCMGSGATYAIRCEEDHDGGKVYQYDGRTTKNAYARGKEHMDKFKAKNEESFMWKHCLEVHDGVEQSFKMHVSGRYKDSPTMLQIGEAIRIQKQNEDKKMVTMNSRNEWGIVKIPRATIQ